jgi:Ca2+-binding RTX toxin-like protein
MMSSILRGLIALVSAALAMAVMAPGAGAAVTPTGNPDALADALDDKTDGAVTAASFDQVPPGGQPTGTFDENLVLFPIAGEDATILSTGDVTDADITNNSPGTSTDNGGGGGGHGGAVFDLVTLRVDFDVPDTANCLTMDFRFLTEEFPEFVGSSFNDGFLVEVDETNFEVGGNGNVTAPNNIAFDPDGFEVTVNSTGTSADNALGTTYDGGSPVLRATTPIEPGSHALFISVYDINDGVFDTAVLLDNLRLRNAKSQNCKRGAAPSPKEGGKCQGKTPTIIASAGIANGTRGRDVILGTDEDDVIRGRGGNDLICGRGGDDEIKGNQGKDRLNGNAGADTIKGNVGGDLIRGRRGQDDLSGQSGNDVIRGGPGRDKVFGGIGDDRLRGNRGKDRLLGRQGDDDLHGNKDPDRLRGGTGIDRCRGGTAEDIKKGCEK